MPGYALYLSRYMLILLATGTLFVCAPLLTTFDKPIRFVIGASSAPLWIALFGWLLGLIAPGAPAWLFMLGPAALALGYLLHRRRYLVTLSILGTFWRCAVELFAAVTAMTRGPWKWAMAAFSCFCAALVVVKFQLGFETTLEITFYRRPLGKFALVALWTACFFCLGALIGRLGTIAQIREALRGGLVWRYALLAVAAAMAVMFSASACCYFRMDIIGTDESHYATQARFFVEDRNSWGIDRYTGEKAGAVFPDDHGPLWPVYLADARFFEPEKIFNSVSIAISFLMTALLFAAILVAASSGVSGSWFAGLLSLILISLYRYSFHFMLQGSRDGFRFISLILIAVLIYDVAIRSIKNDDIQLYDIFFIFLFSFFCMNGHGGNSVIMAGLFVGLSVILFFSKRNIRLHIYILLAMGLGIIIPLYNNIINYLTFRTLRTATNFVFRDTEIFNLLKIAGAARMSPERILSTYSKYDCILICIGIFTAVSAIVFFVEYVLNKGHLLNKRKIEFAIFGVLATGMLLPLTGVFNIMGNTFNLWFVAQLRYRIYFLLIFAMTGAIFINGLIRNNNNFFRVAAISLVLFVSILSTFSMFTYYPPANTYQSNVFSSFYTKLTQKVESSIIDGNIYISHEQALYYFRRSPKLLFHPIARPLISARTNNEIVHAINSLNIGAVVINNKSKYHDFSVLPFYNFLETASGIEKYVFSDEPTKMEYTVWIIRNRSLLRSELETRETLPPS